MRTTRAATLVPVMWPDQRHQHRPRAGASVTYWHVELDAHDILLAEGLPAESYLDWGDRPFFTEGSDHALHNPDFVVPGLSGPLPAGGRRRAGGRGRAGAPFGRVRCALAQACAWDEAERFTWIAA